MRGPWSPGLGAAAVLSVVLCAQDAHAYCQLTTEQALTSRCPQPCFMRGIPLAWQTDPVYTFHESFIPGFEQAEVRRIFSDSFGQWSSTDCLEGPLNLQVTQDPETTDVDEAIKDDGLSIVVYRSPEEWNSLHPASGMAFALTIVAFDTNTGELVGADMELNGGIGTFAECPPEGCAPGEAVDLANVVTHEAGHFLGLGHSDVIGSTMFCDAQGWQVDKRTLELDDIEGICSVYGAVPPDTGGGDGGCQASEGHSRTGLVAWVLAACLLALRRRRLV